MKGGWCRLIVLRYGVVSSLRQCAGSGDVVGLCEQERSSFIASSLRRSFYFPAHKAASDTCGRAGAP